MTEQRKLQEPPYVFMVEGATRMEQEISEIGGVGCAVETRWYDEHGTLLRQDQCVVVTEQLFDLTPETAQLA